MKFNIAIDGHSSCGKSTIAKQLAQHFKFRYIDSGAMYRAVTLYLRQHNLLQVPLNEEAIISILDMIEIDFKFIPEQNKSSIFLNGVDVESLIRTLEIAEWVSPVSALSSVRKKLVHLQQKMAQDGGVVMDGRDICTVVLPNAQIKLFITANIDVRAKRRWLELHNKGEEHTLESISKNLQERDFIDSTRADSPLVQSPDAFVLDNSELSRDEQFQLILNYISSKVHANTV